jgi:hypothetical protein
MSEKPCKMYLSGSEKRKKKEKIWSKYVEAAEN